jgi:hypothetical protein
MFQMLLGQQQPGRGAAPQTSTPGSSAPATAAPSAPLNPMQMLNNLTQTLGSSPAQQRPAQTPNASPAANATTNTTPAATSNAAPPAIPNAALGQLFNTFTQGRHSR